MRTVRHLLEVAGFRRHKAYCLVRDAPSMPLAEDRVRLFQYAQFFEEEAVKLEGRVRGLHASASRLGDTTQRNARVLESKRDLAQQIRAQAETMARDSLRATALKQAERLEAEANGLEIVVRATRRA